MNKFKEHFKQVCTCVTSLVLGKIKAEVPNLPYSVLEKLRTFVKISPLIFLPILKAIYPSVYILSRAAARLHMVKISIRPPPVCTSRNTMASTVFTGGSRFRTLSMGSPSFLPEKRRKKTKALPMNFSERQRLCCCLWRAVIYSSSS